MSTQYYAKVRKHLSANCPVMRGLISRVGPCTLERRGEDPFTLLVRCVIGQQISTKAASSIFDRLAKAVTGPPAPHPTDGMSVGMWQREATIPLAKLAKFTEAKYKACGVSGPKQRTLRGVIDFAKSNPDVLTNIANHEDAEIRERLTTIKGIGPWTVDMFLLFGLGRPDVWPVGDFGVKVAVRTLFNLRKLPDEAKLTKIAKPWEPHRSVASWYLWRSLDPLHKEAET